jgi:predicted permease
MVSRFRPLAWFRRISRIGRLGPRSTVERDMQDEFCFHIDAYAADLVRKGLTPEEARRRALVEFGGVEAWKIDGREALGLRLFDELRGDLRYTWRQLRRSKGFACVAILSIALGIGANTAIFSLMEAALWKAMPLRDPARLRLFTWVSGPNEIMNSSWGTWSGRVTSRGGIHEASFSYPVFKAFEQAPAPFERVFAMKPINRVTVTIDDRAELILAHLVSGGFYEGVGIVPVAGRPILPSDDREGRTEIVAAISEGFWARRFGRDPAVIGRSIRVNGVPVTIVGVNPPGFGGLQSDQAADLFMPISVQHTVLPQRNGRSMLDNPDYWWVNVFGRLKPGVTDAQAERALQITFRDTVRATLPDRVNRDQPYLRLLAGSRGLDNLREEFRRPLFVLLSFVVVVLLLACTNVANLLLARASTRRRELSLRLALGAGRVRLTRQLLTEGLVLGLAGGALGLLFGYWTRDVIPRMIVPSWSAERIGAEFDGRVLAIVMAVTIATTVLFSLAPILQAWRIDVHASLKDGGRTMANAAHPMRGRSLVIAQVCLSVLLLIGAGLFLRTLWNLRSIPLGFRPEQVVLLRVDPPRTGYVKQARVALFEEIDRRIAAIPGVAVSSLSHEPVVSGSSSTTRVEIPGKTLTPAEASTHINTVGHRFFETMDIPILAGRTFDGRDHKKSSKVAIVNQQFVRRFFPDVHPVGRSFKSNGATYEIVGICGDVHYSRPRIPAPSTYYPLFAQAEDAGWMTFEVRSAQSLSALTPLIREAVRAVDKDLPVFDLRTQTQQIDSTMMRERLFVTLTTAFGVLALILSSVGIYGIMAQNVSRRTGEIGVRLALGAPRAGVLLMVLREASLLAVIGIVLGTAAALGLSRYIKSMLFGLTQYDPVAIGGAIVTMLVVAVLAGWMPARRACRLDPMVALRHE